jgi:serine/threonine-protein kinase
VRERLGAGGFGTAYRVVQLGRTKSFSGEYCLKIAADPTAWHREAYFGDLLKDEPGTIRVYESFAWVREKSRKPLYCLKTELAKCGDLARYLAELRKPWKEAKARRAIVRLLRPVKLLHDAAAVHRDITPLNVFVTSNGSLKLGDFGIASHRAGKHHVLADAFAPWFAPPGMAEGDVATFKPADDVYHLGQLFAILLCGSAESKLTARDVKGLCCSAEAKSVIQRCIGLRRKRFANAAVMLAALEEQEPIRPANVRSLNGKRIVFTGPLNMWRSKAKWWAEKAGGIVQRRVGHQTNVVVLGDNSPHFKAGSKGQKLLDVDRERELGHRIAVIKERRFRVLTGAPRN